MTDAPNTTLIRRVADAIKDQMCGDDNAPDDLARAAIQAMREPSSAMVAAANRNNHPRDIDTWHAMIDEALA